MFSKWLFMNKGGMCVSVPLSFFSCPSSECRLWSPCTCGGSGGSSSARSRKRRFPETEAEEDTRAPACSAHLSLTDSLREQGATYCVLRFGIKR